MSSKTVWLLAGIALLIAALLWAVSLVSSDGSVFAKAFNRPPADGSLTVTVKPDQHGTYLIYCSDANIGAAQRLQKFLRVKAEPLVTLGGPLSIAMTGVDLPDNLTPARRVMVEILKRHAPTRVILVGHDDCLIFDSIRAWQNDSTDARARQIAVLKQARQSLRIWLPNTTVDIYYAEKLSDTKLRFYPVTAAMLAESRRLQIPNP